MNTKLVYGVGINDIPKSTSAMPLQYKAWLNMLRRCYDPNILKSRPTYYMCTVCDEWLIFSNFNSWFNDNYVKGFCLDKDILYENNKQYSPATCRFIPNRINTILTNRGNDRGKYPLGVNYSTRHKKYYSMISICGKNKNLGYFDNIEDAHLAWAVAKKKYVIEVANNSYMLGEIGDDIYNSLISRDFFFE